MTTTDTPEGANLTMHILDRHVELATWIESGEAIQWFESYLVAQRDDENPQQGPFDDVPEAAAMYAEKVSRMLGLAETYWVAPDMADLIEQAAPTIERLPLRQHVIPSRYGFLQFPKTMVLGVDEHDEPWGVDAVSWAIADSDDDMTQWYDLDNVAHEAPGLFIIWWVEMARELKNRPERYAPIVVPDLSWAAPAHITAWTFDLDWADDAERTFTVDAVGELQRKLLMTTFQLLGDELVKVWQEHAGRGARRRAARALKTPQPGDVHIVDLRKTRVLGKPEPEECDEPVLWTHRWIVRGHWRTLHRGDSNKEKQVYVRQHVKGPDDRPLIVKDRLSRLVR